MEPEKVVKITDLITEQALAIISKTSPFAQIPLVNSAIISIAKDTIKIVLHQTLLKDYTKRIEEDVNKQAIKAKEAREKLKNAVTAEEKQKYEEELKSAMRELLSFKP